MRGYVLATDIGPTILDRLGLAIPSPMSGEPIRGEGAADPSFLAGLADRLASIGPRRGPVLGLSILAWVGLTVLAAIAFGRRGLRAALPVLAVAVAYLPAVLLLTAALEPSELAEGLIAGAGSPMLALVTLRLSPGFGALAIAGAVTTVGYGVDVVAGSHLTELSLAGPNPAGGVRFYGVGNELEAIVGALVPIAAGAALVAWAPGARSAPPRSPSRSRPWRRSWLSRPAGSAPTSGRRSGYRSARRLRPACALTPGAGRWRPGVRRAVIVWRRWRGGPVQRRRRASDPHRAARRRSRSARRGRAAAPRALRPQLRPLRLDRHFWVSWPPSRSGSSLGAASRAGSVIGAGHGRDSSARRRDARGTLANDSGRPAADPRHR